ncbi:MAG: MerR family transcriptional regulator [Actinobacteria bacterium]|nr:MerR family transcriptional regulator [Actinomycetota bacterium]
MGFRVDELAGRAGVSVDTVRFYQSKGLLAQPAREGRIAWYSDVHLERLERIRDLKAKGFTLASIGRLLEGDLDAADEVLVEALAGPEPGREDPPAPLSRTELAARTGLAPELIAALGGQGLLTPELSNGRPLYSEGDVAALKAGLTLLETGVPLEELLALARQHDRAMKQTAERTVELFDEFVRSPIKAKSASEVEAADRLMDAFHKMLPAASALVTQHFRAVLLAAARERLGAPAEPTERPGAPGQNEPLGAPTEPTERLGAPGQNERLGAPAEPTERLGAPAAGGAPLVEASERAQR